MRNRSNLLVLLGIAFFVVGGIIVYVLTSDDDDNAGTGGQAPVTVVVAAKDIEAGSLGDELIENGSLREEEVAASQVAAGALQSVDQLRGSTFVQGFASGNQVTAGGVTALNRTFDVPPGFEAIAVQIDFVAGGAGYVSPGDRVNLYGAFSDRYPLGDLSRPHAELLLTNVEVLDVNLTIPARRGTAVDDASQPRTSSENITYLLAVRTADAEKLVYTTEFQALYATLTADDAAPAGPTPGRDGENIFEVEPNAAAA